MQKRLAEYTAIDYKGDGLLFSKIKSLILDLIHSIDVVDQLSKD